MQDMGTHICGRRTGTCVHELAMLVSSWISLAF